MAGWLSQNIGTIAVLMVLVAVVALVIVFMHRGSKSGKSVCGCDGCKGCPMAGKCHEKRFPGTSDKILRKSWFIGDFKADIEIFPHNIR